MPMRSRAYWLDSYARYWEITRIITSTSYCTREIGYSIGLCYDKITSLQQGHPWLRLVNYLWPHISKDASRAADQGPKPLTLRPCQQKPTSSRTTWFMTLSTFASWNIGRRSLLCMPARLLPHLILTLRHRRKCDIGHEGQSNILMGEGISSQTICLSCSISARDLPQSMPPQAADLI